MLSKPFVVEWLTLHDVESSGTQVPRVECRQQRDLVDDRAAGGVDQDRARPHSGDCLRVDEVKGRTIEVTVQTHEMALLKKILEPINPPNSQRFVHPLAKVRVVEHHV